MTINIIYRVSTNCVLDLILNNGFAHVCNTAHNNINYNNYDIGLSTKYVHKYILFKKFC